MTKTKIMEKVKRLTANSFFSDSQKLHRRLGGSQVFKQAVTHKGHKHKKEDFQRPGCHLEKEEIMVIATNAFSLTVLFKVWRCY